MVGPLLLASAFPRWCAAETAELWDRTFSPLPHSTTPLKPSQDMITICILQCQLDGTQELAFGTVLVSTVVHTVILRIDPCNSGDCSAARTGRGAMHGFLFLPPDASHTTPSTSRDNLHHPSPLDRLRLRDRSCVGACRCAAQISGNCSRERAHQTCPRRRIL